MPVGLTVALNHIRLPQPVQVHFISFTSFFSKARLISERSSEKISKSIIILIGYLSKVKKLLYKTGSYTKLFVQYFPVCGINLEIS